MSKKNLRHASIALLCVLGAVVFWPRDHVTQPNFDRIEKGMTVQEVEDILGPGLPYRPWCDADHLSLTWEGRDLQIIVSFDGPEKRVLWRGYYPRENRPLLDRVRVWLGF